ncbi:MAG: N-acetylmuramoyl-L-alanine amidase, partial [Firmicutes bacterium]|nr:N-acetylmuramoyl-L-alanine amidase [Bacillota bacterium]
RQTNMPACLTELAFISNPAEEALLKSADFQARAAGAIAAGIAGYLALDQPAQSGEPAPTPATVSVWAQNSWAKAVAAGLFDGLNPQGSLTREQVAVVLDRLGLLKR